MSKPVKLLIFSGISLSDQIFSFPVIEQLKKRYQNLDITVLTARQFKGFFSDNPYISSCITYNSRHIHKLRFYTRLIKDIKKENYSIFISLHHNFRFCVLGRLSHIPIRIGHLKTPLFYYCFNKTVFQNDNDFVTHKIKLNLGLLAPFFIKTTAYKNEVFLNSKAKRDAESWVKKFLIPNRKIIVFMVSSGLYTHSFRQKAVKDFIDLVSKTKKYDIVLVGRREKSESLYDISGEGVLNLIGKTSPAQLTALIKLCDIYIGGDSGPAQIASLCDKPIIFYSSYLTRFPTRFGPQSSYFKVIRRDYFRDKEKAIPDGVYLYHIFCELINQVSLNAKFNYKTRRDYLMLNTVRVLYLYRSKKEFDAILEPIKLLRKKGLIILTKPVQSGFITNLVGIFKLSKLHNINIIQAENIPFWFAPLFRFFYKFNFKRFSPITLNQSIHKYIELEEYLNIYRKELKEFD